MAGGDNSTLLARPRLDWDCDVCENQPLDFNITGMPCINNITMRRLRNNPSILCVLNKFFTTKFWELIVAEANKFAAQNKVRPNGKIDDKWFNLTVDKLKTFFALCLLTSQVKTANLRDYS